MGALVKTICRCIKVSFALEVRKSVSKDLTFAKSNFLDLADFITVDKFSISLPPTLPSPFLSNLFLFDLV